MGVVGARRALPLPLRRAYCLTPVLSFRKRAGAISQDHRAIFGVEFGSVAEVFVHQRFSVVDVFGAEDVAELMNQSDHVEFGLGVGTVVMKYFSDGYDDIIRQSLLTIADSVDARSACHKNTAHRFSRESDDEIVVLAFRLSGKFFLQECQQIGS